MKLLWTLTLKVCRSVCFVKSPKPHTTFNHTQQRTKEMCPWKTRSLKSSLWIYFKNALPPPSPFHSLHKHSCFQPYLINSYARDTKNIFLPFTYFTKLFYTKNTFLPVHYPSFKVPNPNLPGWVGPYIPPPQTFHLIGGSNGFYTCIEVKNVTWRIWSRMNTMSCDTLWKFLIEYFSHHLICIWDSLNTLLKSKDLTNHYRILLGPFESLTTTENNKESETNV